MEEINNRKLTINLLKEWLIKLEEFEKSKREVIFKIGESLYNTDLDFLYKVNKAILTNEQIYNDKSLGITYEKNDSNYSLTYQGEKINFNLEEIKKVVVGLTGILEKIYPLGTTVTLKKQYLEKLLNTKKVEEVAIVIVSRFIFKNKNKGYFEYAGVVYPLGFVGDTKTIQFTPALIESVLKEGYTDEKDEGYIYLMKKELIIEKGKHSFGFATKEEVKDFEKQMGVDINE